MSAKVSTAIEILYDQGPKAFAKETSLFLISQAPFGMAFLYDLSMRQIRSRMDEEENLDDILDTVLEVRPGYRPYQLSATQLRDEIRPLAELVDREQPQTVLEIGTSEGGTFYIWSRFISSANTLVSVDLPGGEFGGGYVEEKQGIYRAFAPSKEMHFMRENSHDEETYEVVADILDDGVDFLFIDADHTYEGVKRDFEMYSQLVNAGGIIALHDIVHHPDNYAEVERRRREVDGLEERHLEWGESWADCNVDRFWEELNEAYDTEEFVSHPMQTAEGIGVVRV